MFAVLQFCSLQLGFLQRGLFSFSIIREWTGSLIIEGGARVGVLSTFLFVNQLVFTLQ